LLSQSQNDQFKRNFHRLWLKEYGVEIRIGPRFNAKCCSIVTRGGRELAWTNVVRYLGIFIMFQVLKYSLFSYHAKRFFYRSFNGIFGRVGQIASNEVIVHLVKSKCFPVLFYGLELCSLRKYQYKSINYVINSTFRKNFNTRSQETVDVCLEMFGCLKAEGTIAIRKRKFLNKYITHCTGYSLSLLRQNLNHVARMFS